MNVLVLEGTRDYPAFFLPNGMIEPAEFKATGETLGALKWKLNYHTNKLHELNGKLKEYLKAPQIGLFGISFSKIISGIKNALSGMITAVKGMVSKIIDNVKSVAEQAMKAAADGLSSIKNIAIDVGKGLVHTAYGSFDSVYSYIEDPTKLVNSIESMGSLALNVGSPNGIFSTLKKGIEGDFKGLISETTGKLDIVSNFVPQLKMVTAGLEIIQNPSSLTDPSKLIELASNTIMPASIKTYADIAKKAMNPKELLDPTQYVNIAKQFNVIQEPYQLLKQNYDEGKVYLNQAGEAKKYFESNVKKIMNEKTNIEGFKKVIDQKVETLNQLAKQAENIKSESAARNLEKAVINIQGQINNEVNKITNSKSIINSEQEKNAKIKEALEFTNKFVEKANPSGIMQNALKSTTDLASKEFQTLSETAKANYNIAKREIERTEEIKKQTESQKENSSISLNNTYSLNSNTTQNTTNNSSNNTEIKAPVTDLTDLDSVINKF